MAVVRLTDELRKQIIDSATNGLSQQIAKLESEVKAVFTPTRIYELLVPEADRKLLKTVPEKYLKRVNHYSVRIAHTTQLGWTVSPTAGELAAWSEPYPTVNIPADIPEWPSIMPLLDRRTKLIEEKIKLKAGLEQLLKNCNALKQVIELWPTVTQHVPDDVLKKHHEKKTRAKALPTELNPEVAAALVKSAMLETK